LDKNIPALTRYLMHRKQLSLDDMITANKKWFLSFGLTEQNIRNYYPAWMEENKSSGTVNDYALYIFNLLLVQNEQHTSDKRQFHNYKASILQRMLEFIRKYEGRKGNEILRQLELERMNEYELTRYEIEVEISSGQCCPWCNALNGKRYSIEDYRREQPLGSTNCANENGCNCTTIPVPLTDINGDLVMKNTSGEGKPGV
jgi:hypothetical protein